MSLLFRSQRAASLTDLGVPPRGMAPRTGLARVTPDSALRSSAVWACLRLRADLISTMPIDVYRRVGGVQVEMTKPVVLVTPGGEQVPITEWLYSSQVDLDRNGNDVGIITAVDGQGKPARIDLQDLSTVKVRGRGSEIVEWTISGKTYSPSEVWHEKQYTLPGIPLGLSPIAYAAWSIGGYLSAQQFALDWFASDANPSGTLRHTTEENISAKVAQVMKDRFKVAVSNRDIFVTGTDWEYTPATADASQAAFLEQMRYGVTDIARFLGVPGDMIDAEATTGSITYANVTQRNLQLLILNLGPAIVRREAALSRLLAQPRYVKFNTDAILRMDPQARGAALLARVAGRTLAPSEARELDNLPPFTPEQIAEFAALFPAKTSPQPGSTPTPNGGAT